MVEVHPLTGSLCFEGLGVTAFLHIPQTTTGKPALCVKCFSSKHALNRTYRAVFPHWPITHVVSSWHTQPAHSLKKNIHPPMQIQPVAGFFNYHVSVSQCKPLRNHTLF